MQSEKLFMTLLRSPSPNVKTQKKISDNKRKQNERILDQEMKKYPVILKPSTSQRLNPIFKCWCKESIVGIQNLFVKRNLDLNFLGVGPCIDQPKYWSIQPF